jgi:hypothetical protein
MGIAEVLAVVCSLLFAGLMGSFIWFIENAWNRFPDMQRKYEKDKQTGGGRCSGMKKDSFTVNRKNNCFKLSKKVHEFGIEPKTKSGEKILRKMTILNCDLISEGVTYNVGLSRFERMIVDFVDKLELGKAK